MTTGDRHDELRSHLRSRIPEPSGNYWNMVDARLRSIESKQGRQQGAFTDIAVGAPTDIDDADIGDADIGGAETDASVEILAEHSTTDEPWWRTGRGLAIAAGLLLVLGLGALAVANRSSDPVADLVAAADQAEADGNADASANGDASEGSLGAPLAAVQARLAGQTADADESTAASGGPYCFSSDDASVFPANELADRRALVWLEVGLDGFVSFYAMQGEIIVVAGSGYPAQTGVLITQPIALAGASGPLPDFTVAITDTAIQFGPGQCLPWFGRVRCSSRSRRSAVCAGRRPGFCRQWCRMAARTTRCCHRLGSDRCASA